MKLSNFVKKVMMCMGLMLGMSFVNAVAAPVTVVDEVQQDNNYVVITGVGVNMRKGPGLNYGVYPTKPNKGAKLTCLGESGDWYKVAWGKGTAYVFKKYAKFVEGTAVAKPKSTPMCQITGQGVRLRLGPGLNYDFLAYPNGKAWGPAKGEKLVITGDYGDWWQVAYADGNYYVSKQFAKKIQ
ncbi:MAG: SH3 domain-containing protein [Prevotella sp.]|nr:SH3 domain-containing protein [Prevotella sp.]